MRNIKVFTSSVLVFIILLLGGQFLQSCNGKKERKPVLSDQEMAQLKEPLIEVNRTLNENDEIRIEKYLSRRNWNMTKTSTGLYYEILEPGKGDSILEGDLVVYDYYIYLIQGDTLYRSDVDGPRYFTVNYSSVEDGLNEAAQLMTFGTRARILLPPHLAYGLRGDDVRIPKRAILIYDINIHMPQ